MPIGACIFRPRIVRKIDEHREFLHEDIGVRLKPEPFSVLAVFDAQMAIGQIGTGLKLDRAPDASVLEAGNRIRNSLDFRN
jgi:hypothetical protein